MGPLRSKVRTTLVLPIVTVLSAATASAALAQSSLSQEEIMRQLTCKAGQACAQDEGATQPVRTRSLGGTTRSLNFRGGSPAKTKKVIRRSLNLEYDNDRKELEKAAASGDYATIDIEIYFEYDSHKITPSARQELTKLGNVLTHATLSKNRIVMIGHTDAAGSETYNMSLSERRARAVKDYLITNFPIQGKRLVAYGRGEEKLKDPANPKAGINRRVQFINEGPVESARQ